MKPRGPPSTSPLSARPRRLDDGRYRRQATPPGTYRPGPRAVSRQWPWNRPGSRASASSRGFAQPDGPAAIAARSSPPPTEPAVATAAQPARAGARRIGSGRRRTPPRNRRRPPRPSPPAASTESKAKDESRKRRSHSAARDSTTHLGAARWASSWTKVSRRFASASSGNRMAGLRSPSRQGLDRNGERRTAGETGDASGELLAEHRGVGLGRDRGGSQPHHAFVADQQPRTEHSGSEHPDRQYDRGHPTDGFRNDGWTVPGQRHRRGDINRGLDRRRRTLRPLLSTRDPDEFGCCWCEWRAIRHDRHRSRLALGDGSDSIGVSDVHLPAFRCTGESDQQAVESHRRHRGRGDRAEQDRNQSRAVTRRLHGRPPSPQVSTGQEAEDQEHGSTGSARSRHNRSGPWPRLRTFALSSPRLTHSGLLSPAKDPSLALRAPSPHSAGRGRRTRASRVLSFAASPLLGLEPAVAHIGGFARP